MTDTSSQTHSHLWPGVALALGSAALFGAAPPLSKLHHQLGHDSR